MSKRTRQQAIIELVSRQRVPSQAALAKQLKKQGYDVTQATLSRDIAELNLVKSKDGYTRPEDAGGAGIPHVPDPVGTLKRLAIKVDSALNQMVIRTSPGGAHPVALALDEGFTDQIVGTIAGDDTILVITRSTEEAEAFKKQFLEYIG